jgi:hypothetical protein
MGYQRVRAFCAFGTQVNGALKQVLHADAWSIFKAVKSGSGGSGISSKLKQRILDEAVRDRQHLIIPDCANQPARLQVRTAQSAHRAHARTTDTTCLPCMPAVVLAARRPPHRPPRLPSVPFALRTAAVCTAARAAVRAARHTGRCTAR